MNLLKKIGLGGSKKNKRGALKRKTLKKNKRGTKADKKNELLIQHKYQSFSSSHVSTEERSIVIHDRYDTDSLGKSDYFSLPAYESAVNLALKYCCGDDTKKGEAYLELDSNGETSTETDSSNGKASKEHFSEPATDLFSFEEDGNDDDYLLPTKTRGLRRSLQTPTGESTRVIIPEISHSSSEDVKTGNRLYAQIMLQRVDENLKNPDRSFHRNVYDSINPSPPPPMYMSSPSSSESGDDNSEDTKDYSIVDDLLLPFSGNSIRKSDDSYPGDKKDRRDLLLQDKTKPGTIGISTAVFASLDDSDVHEITGSSKETLETKRLIEQERKRQEEHRREKEYKAMHKQLKNERKKNDLIAHQNKSKDTKEQCSEKRNQKRSTNTALYDLLVKGNCVICKERSRTHLAVPCMHYSFCEACSLELSKKSCQVKCPVCNKEGIMFSKLKY